MKRLMPSSLITFLENNPNCLRAHLFSIALPTGQTLYATDGQWDITVPYGTGGWNLAQTTFKAVANGVWSRDKIISEASYKCSSNSTKLTCTPQPSTNYPGLSIGILNAAANHLFEGSTVWIYAAYMPMGNYGNVGAGVETKGQYVIAKSPLIARNQVQFDCADPMFYLNMKVPSRLMQSNCPWSFCDGNCGLTASNYTVTFTAKTGSTQSALTPVTAFTQAASYFAQGVVKCLTGNNAGLSATVKAFSGGVLTLMVPWLLPVAVGDTFAAIKGCDKTLPTCSTGAQANGTVVNNSVHFGGTPFVPPPSTSV